MKQMMIGIFTMLFIVTGRADEAALHFDQANQAYRSGEYRDAITTYEQVLASGQESSELYYNLGNAYFKIENIPAAILNYEKAERLTPGDEDINYNLYLANLRVIDKIEPVPELFFVQWWNAVLSSFSSEVWAVIAIIAVWCTAIAAGVMLATRSFLVQRIAIIAVVLTLIACVFCSTAAYQRYHNEETGRFAVVFSPSVSVKSAPDKQSTDLFVLHEGVKVELLDEVGVWRKIRLADGKVGWLSTDAINII